MKNLKNMLELAGYHQHICNVLGEEYVTNAIPSTGITDLTTNEGLWLEVDADKFRVGAWIKSMPGFKTPLQRRLAWSLV